MLLGRRKILVLAVAAGAALSTAPLTPASAASAASRHVIIVAAGPSGFTVSGPTTRHAGRVTLHFTSSNPASHTGPGGSDVVLVKMLHGRTVRQLIAKIGEQGADGPPTRASLARAAASTRWITRNTHLFGGAALEGRGRADVTETLYAGTYRFIDVNAIFAHRHVTVRTLHVVGTPPRHQAALPRVGATIRTTSADRFRAPAVLPAHRSYLIRNVADTVHFVVFAPVRRGTTDATISAFARAILANKRPASDPFDHSKLGVQSGALSPGTQQVFSSRLLTPGTYNLECFIADDRTGMAHFFMGMHKIVVIR